jgi:hypothetical protein
MPNLHGSQDQLPELHSKLKEGILGDYDIHGRDKTTVRIKWIQEFRSNMRRFSRNNEYWSQTECEMVVAREAIEEQRRLFGDTAISWAGIPKQFVRCVKPRSGVRQEVRTVAQSLQAQLSIFNVDQTVESEEDYICVLKKDSRKLNTDSFDYGMSSQDRLLIGIARLIIGNEEMFFPNLVSESKRIINNVEDQMESRATNVQADFRHLGKLLGRARDTDAFNEDTFSRLVEENRASEYIDSEPVEMIIQGYNESIP